MTIAAGHPDWLKASALIDDPAVLEEVTSAAVPRSGAIIDVRRWQSYTLFIQSEAADAGPPANVLLFEVQWSETSTMGTFPQAQHWTVNSLLSTDCGPTYIRGPMDGAFMRINVFGGATSIGPVTYKLVGSHRPLTDHRAFEVGPTADRGLSKNLILARMTDSVAAATTVERNVRIGPGPAMMHTRFGTAGGTWDVFLYEPQRGATTGVIWAADNLAAGSSEVFRLSLPRAALTLRVVNDHATNSGSPRITLVTDNN